MMARPTGDEFVILLPELARSADAAFVAGKILAALGQPVTLRGAELTATASIGIALFEPGCRDDMQELLKKADGRNAYRFYQETPEGGAPALRIDERFSGG